MPTPTDFLCYWFYRT